MNDGIDHGLSPETVRRIHSVLAAFPKVESAILYGSRAKGNYKRGSDIDLALKGAGLTWTDLGEIVESIDDLFMPHETDLLIYDLLSDDALRGHIDRVGKIFYRCQPLVMAGQPPSLPTQTP
jgi:predicted nucleotidyltransferase